MLLSSFLAFGFAAAPALAGVRYYTLNIANSVIAPDGGATRDAVLANGQFPGPLITANVGDHLQVRVVNQLTDQTMAQGTSIHWHGILQHRTAEMDGAAWVTQCPISPGQEFTYNISLHQTGTYWYHSHITTQYCDGLRGPLVIYDPKDPLRHLYDFDDASTVITLGDWLHEPSPEGFINFENPESTNINGLGRLPGKSNSPLAVINVQCGKRYRLRVLNTACISAFNFSIDGHTMKVLETDGEETAYHNQESYSVFPIFPAQRLSLLLEANQEPGNFWIRAEPSFMTLGAPVYPSNQTGVNMAILRYKGAPNKEPTTNQTGFDLAVEETFIPLKPLPGISGTPDISMVLNIGVNASNPAAPAFTINNYTYSSVPVPILLQILNGTDPRQLLPAGSVITLPRNKLIELKIPGGSILSPHPFHLHGHKFGVVRSAGTSFVNEVNPPIRDTVSTGGLTSDNVTMRFTTDNPGPWIFHCHIDFHLEAGLAVVFAEDPEGIISGPKSQKITDSWKELCPIWDGLKSGKQFSLSDIP